MIMPFQAVENYIQEVQRMNKGKKFIAALFCVMLLVGLCAGMTANAAVESVTDVNDLKYAIEWGYHSFLWNNNRCF